ncbi:Ovarian tumor otubain [Neofusicoccum parvum]|uniref:Putative otu domain-containing protein 6b protein n=1 Tax=Botryosphaeria parva (strain UCR-NP2) TaxID=1287680 RepID=R1EDF3_BOTPV|nr:putative otu domain-containing protein 6b protein [Neofusicoccum parvum UCRNP2]GME32494.1 Ovarian tumor otubain [Neofusicoccum parvum]
MEELHARHRKEQRDLQSRITQKKKGASKKTRKGVNDECANLERELKERQEREIAELTGSNGDNTGAEAETDAADAEDAAEETDDLAGATEKLSISSGQPAAPATNGTESPDAQSQGPKRKGNRQKARLARRAAEQDALVAEAAAEAQSMPDLRKAERTALLEQFQKRGLKEQVIRADGHCLYSAIADQMASQELDLKPRIAPKIIGQEEDGEADSKQESYSIVRKAAADWIASHADDFAPFLEEPLDSYVVKVRDTGEWGGHMELLALARTYGVNIKVLHSDGRVDAIEHCPEGETPAVGEEKELWLAYYKHGFGLGEHYNSLRKGS